MTPPPVIVLCAPRSFSSVVAAMLGQHPGLYAFPELNLFLTDTLGELIDWEREAGAERGYLLGLRRAVAQLECGEQSGEALESAGVWLTERRAWPTARVLDWLAQYVAARALVDKSPRTAMARRSCKRLKAMMPEGRYLHLVRHPVACIQSLVSTAGEQGSHVNCFFAQVWAACQQNIFELTESLERERVFRVRGEDLLGSPEATLREILTWLRLPAGSMEITQMKHPEGWPFAFPLPGEYGGDNDPGFLASPQLRAPEPMPAMEEVAALDLGKEITEQVLYLGRRLGYD
jgi:hypothetical protein